ncbi:MAG: D-aminoacylase [Candidatus Aminicenantes bacterium]|nr:D-aminoacylase [Candidatus Aminicenantes bacterium]
MKKVLIFLLWLLPVVFLQVSCNSNRTDFDILITNGTIVDGSGKPGFRADIGIIGETISEIGNLKGKSAEKIVDADGLIISPGFIDVHTHCDGGLGSQESKANLNYLIQGTTTVVTGNCGGGTFKVAEVKAEWEKTGIGTNAVHLVGFGEVRHAVMQDEPRAPKPEELEEMKTLLRQAMKEGAWGMSTGLEYIPDMYSSTEEIIALTKIVSEFGGVYASHQRNEVARVPEATRETIKIAEKTGVPVDISHLKICGKGNWGMMSEVITTIEDARAKGVPITADMYPYDKAATGPLISIRSNSGWSCFRLPDQMEPFASLREKMHEQEVTEPELTGLKDLYIKELAKALSNQSKRRQIKDSVLIGEPHDPSPVAVSGWDSYAIVASDKYPQLIGKILSDLAEEQKKDAFDIAADLVVDEPEMYLSCGALSEVDMKVLMKKDWLMFSSDGSASPVLSGTDPVHPGHPRSFGSQARVIRKYVREDKVLTLEEAVRKMTSLPASFLHLKNRGTLAEGFVADFVIFDPDKMQDNATYSNPRQYASGTAYILVNGKISVENGKYNGALNGKMLLLTENK